MNHDTVYRTAPATPGLLNRLCHSDQKLIGEASAGEGLRLQPAQQACFKPNLVFNQILFSRYVQLFSVISHKMRILSSFMKMSAGWTIS